MGPVQCRPVEYDLCSGPFPFHAPIKTQAAEHTCCLSTGHCRYHRCSEHHSPCPSVGEPPGGSTWTPQADTGVSRAEEMPRTQDCWEHQSSAYLRPQPAASCFGDPTGHHHYFFLPILWPWPGYPGSPQYPVLVPASWLPLSASQKAILFGFHTHQKQRGADCGAGPPWAGLESLSPHQAVGRPQPPRLVTI